MSLVCTSSPAKMESMLTMLVTDRVRNRTSIRVADHDVKHWACRNRRRTLEQDYESSCSMLVIRTFFYRLNVVKVQRYKYITEQIFFRLFDRSREKNPISVLL